MTTCLHEGWQEPMIAVAWRLFSGIDSNLFEQLPLLQSICRMRAFARAALLSHYISCYGFQFQYPRHCRQHLYHNRHYGDDSIVSEFRDLRFTHYHDSDIFLKFGFQNLVIKCIISTHNATSLMNKTFKHIFQLDLWIRIIVKV